MKLSRPHKYSLHGNKHKTSIGHITYTIFGQGHGRFLGLSLKYLYRGWLMCLKLVMDSENYIPVLNVTYMYLMAAKESVFFPGI